MSTGYFDRLCRTIVISCAVALMGGGLVTPAFAVNTEGLFELDRNAQDASPPDLPQDWSYVLSGTYAGPGTPTKSEAPFPSVPSFPGVLSDPSRASGGGTNVNDATIFTGGGSKDVNDVSQWKWTDGSIPDKDDITNAYAIAYSKNIGGSDHLIAYFGADRFAVNGDAQIGFWFFQQDVRLGAGGKFTNGIGGATATHTNGDLLILADFTQGGSVGTVKVYEWLNGALSTNPVVTGGECVSGGGDEVCAMINLEPTSSPWPYTPKSGTAGTFPTGAFFEGGIDITAIFSRLGQDVPCFASFLAETRSSQSPTAQLKDLVLGAFPVCGMTIGKACYGTPVFNADTNLVTTVFTSEIKNTGFGKIFDVTIQEDPIFTLSTDSAGSQCTLTSGATASGANGSVLVDKSNTATNKPPQVKVFDELGAGASATLTITCTSSRKKLVNTIFVMAKTSSTSTVFSVPEASHTTLDTTTPPETCSAVVPANVQVSKSCNKVTMENGVTPNVCVDVTVTNKGAQDLKLTKLEDTEPGGVSGVDLLAALKAQNQIPGDDVVLQQSGKTGDSLSVKHCYTPQAGSSVDPAIDHFDDTAIVEGLGTFDQSFATDTSDPATCYLCPQP